MGYISIGYIIYIISILKLSFPFNLWSSLFLVTQVVAEQRLYSRVTWNVVLHSVTSGATRAVWVIPWLTPTTEYP